MSVVFFFNNNFFAWPFLFFFFRDSTLTNGSWLCGCFQDFRKNLTLLKLNKRDFYFHKDPSIIEIYVQTSHKRIQLVIFFRVNWKESLMSDVACFIYIFFDCGQHSYENWKFFHDFSHKKSNLNRMLSVKTRATLTKNYETNSERFMRISMNFASRWSSPYKYVEYVMMTKLCCSQISQRKRHKMKINTQKNVKTENNKKFFDFWNVLENQNEKTHNS